GPGGTGGARWRARGRDAVRSGGIRRVRRGTWPWRVGGTGLGVQCGPWSSLAVVEAGAPYRGGGAFEFAGGGGLAGPGPVGAVAGQELGFVLDQAGHVPQEWFLDVGECGPQAWCRGERAEVDFAPEDGPPAQDGESGRVGRAGQVGRGSHRGRSRV